MVNARSPRNGEAQLARRSPPGRPEDAIDAWVAETASRALAYAISLVGNRADAEDVVHDCFGRLLARSDHYDLPRDGTKLLFRSITNACINRTRRRPPVVSLDGADPLALADKAEPGPEGRAILNELEGAVAEALASLPLNQRAVIELRSLGHSLVEAAEMLEVSQANARVLLHRARQALAARLRPYIEDPVT